MSDDLVIRAARPGDVGAIARIHVAGWAWAYPGLIPDEVIRSRTEADREAMWTLALSQTDAPSGVWVAERAGRVVGFVGTGAIHDDDADPLTAELHTIYLEPEAVGTGVGRALMARAVTDLAERGFTAAMLWVFESNERARRFYEMAGWRTDGKTTTQEWGDHQIPVVRYRIDLPGNPPSSS